LGDSDDRQKIDGLKDIFAELNQADPASAKLVTDAIEYVRSKRHLTEFGALTDVLTPEGTDREARREAQVLAATLPPSGTVDVGRRQAIQSLLGWGATAVAGGALAGVIGNIATHELQRPETYAESFVKEVLRLHSDRPALWEWREDLLRSGRTDEAELISVVAVHGEGFWDAFTAISRLREIIDAAKISDFSKAYLELNYAGHHRYLGLTRQAFDLHDSFVHYNTNDHQLNVLLLNQQHMNRHLVLGDLAHLKDTLPTKNNDLARAMREKLDIDPASMAVGSFEQAKSISVECIALKGLYLLHNCIASGREGEALEALGLIDQYRRRLVSTLIAPEISEGRHWMAIRLYGEAVWNYGRVAPIALLQGWDRVLERCLDAFYSPDAAASSLERSVIRDFHRIEGAELRSPIWIQMALVQTIRHQLISGTGPQSLQRLLPREKQYKIRHHSGLQRSLDALNAAFGGSVTDVSEINSLAAIENQLMLECVREMLRRTTH